MNIVTPKCSIYTSSAKEVMNTLNEFVAVLLVFYHENMPIVRFFLSKKAASVVLALHIHEGLSGKRG